MLRNELLHSASERAAHPDPALLKVEVLDAPEETKQAILGGNAARLLG